jgi:flagellar biosynthesis protein FlhG
MTARSKHSDQHQPCTIYSVGGGKGGVGKSVLSIGMGMALARTGRSTVLVDLDLGAANLHTYLGIRGRTPTIADFILNKVPSLENIVVETNVPNLGLVCGAEFVPGITNPAHWMKIKLLRHLRSLPADHVIVDLGAGVHFNTLDFFGISDRGVVITAPEPGAVMNAYSFIKGGLFRKVQSVFKNHPDFSLVIEEETRREDSATRFTLEWFSEKLRSTAPDLLPLLEEISRSFRPALVINRVPEGQTHILVRNLIALCGDKLGVTLDHVGDLPEVKELSNNLLNVPQFLDRPQGMRYYDAVRGIVERILSGTVSPERTTVAYEFSDDEIEAINGLMDTLDERVFQGTNRRAWKLRLFFKPAEVVGFLISRGVTHDLFYRSP